MWVCGYACARGFVRVNVFKRASNLIVRVHVHVCAARKGGWAPSKECCPATTCPPGDCTHFRRWGVVGLPLPQRDLLLQRPFGVGGHLLGLELAVRLLERVVLLVAHLVLLDQRRVLQPAARRERRGVGVDDVDDVPAGRVDGAADAAMACG